MSGLIAGGYPAGEAIRLLTKRTKDPRIRAMTTAIWERLSSGTTLSEAMSAWPAVFDAHILNLIRAGEATGSLREVLKRLIDHLTEATQLRRRIINALAYPCFICVLAGGMLIFFMSFLFPKIEVLLHSLGGKMPLPTQILLDTSHFLVHYGLLIAAIVGIAGIGMAWWWKTPDGRLAIDQTILQIPLIGSLAIETTIQSFSQTLAVLIENGITTTDALRIAERTIGNRALEQSFRSATNRVLEGQSLMKALATIPHVPDYVIDLLSVGENTGKLAPQLRDLAATMQEELSQRIKGITSLLSTAVLFGAFAFVAFIAYAVVAALLQVSGSLKI